MLGAALVVVWARVAERCIRDRPWRRLASQWTQMAEQGIDERRTLIIFDWDDTVLPSTWIQDYATLWELQ